MADSNVWDESTDLPQLIAFTELVDSDDIIIKEKIKQALLNNKFIIHAIGNKELEEAGAEPDEYYGENILPFYILPETQHNNQTYICYEVGFEDVYNYQKALKVLKITFYILCDHTDKGWCIDAETGIPRHDLIASLITYQLNNEHCLGDKIVLTSDTPSTTDSYYSTRTLVFEQYTDNNLVKTTKGVTKMDNKGIWLKTGESLG